VQLLWLAARYFLGEIILVEIGRLHSRLIYFLNSSKQNEWDRR
jgi:hypothetical protein